MKLTTMLVHSLEDKSAGERRRKDLVRCNGRVPGRKPGTQPYWIVLQAGLARSEILTWPSKFYLRIGMIKSLKSIYTLNILIR